MEAKIQKYSNFVDIAKTAPELLIENQNRVTKAVTFGETLIAKIQKQGMSKELDSEINEYLVKLRKTLAHVKEKRTPITQLLNSITKEFTGCEQLLDVKREDTTWFKLQKIRNDFAKELAEIARVEEEKIKLEINRNLELEQLKPSIEEHVKMKYNEHLYGIKEGLRVIFNGLTLEDWNEGTKLINDHQEEITLELYRTWVLPYSPVYMSIEDRDDLIKTVMLGMRDKLNSDLQVEIATIKQGFVSEYQAKKNELVALAESKSKEEADRIKKEAEERETKRLADLAAEKKRKDDEARDAANVKKEESQINAHFTAQTVETEKPKPTGYTIEITSTKGYLPIMNFWYEKEGSNLPFDAINRMTVGRMKKFCEAYAHKQDEKIVSPYLKYTEVYNMKAK